MEANEIEREIEKLRLKKLELTNKINLTLDYDERDFLEREIERIDKQIQLLEKLKTK
jgi:hypothetical protein